MRTPQRIAMASITIFLVSTVLAQTISAAAQRGVGMTSATVIAGKPSEFAFRLSKKIYPLGTTIFTVKNSGAIVHSFKVCSKPSKHLVNTCNGKGSKKLAPGRSTKLTVVFKAKGTYEYLCTIAGHAAAGMKGIITVK